MRYEDASGAFQASGPIANDDADALAAGSRGPATGNLITGEGTQYGAAGADSAADAHVAAIAGQSGEDSSFAGGKLSVTGQYGSLTVDAEGNYSYLANTGAPENVRDRFTYTLADNQGNTDTGALIVEIGKTPAVIKADAQQVVVGPDGVVTLPPGVELSDIMVVGRNLVVNMPDGTQLVIVDGAVFVPQLVLGGVEIPATNVAALLIGQEVQPAAGEVTPSSGGNFALPPPPLDPGVPLGDLLPPTEYDYTPPEPQETFLPLDEDPEIFVQPDGQPAQVNAVDQVDEAGLPTRNEGEPEGTGEGADGDPSNDSDTSEATSGLIIYNSPDGVASITINGVPVTTVGQIIAGDFGTLEITSIADGQIGYLYTLSDNTSGDATHDDFSVVLTDEDGDQASATLTINIIDDTPTAVDDTDSIPAGEFGPATGNVLTDADAGDAGDSDDGADTVGADDAELTNVTGFGDTESVEGGWVVQGQYGVLTIHTDGSYDYVRDPGTPGGVEDVFNYTLTDGDGDSDTATLTIDIGDATPETRPNPTAQLDDDALANGIPGGAGDDPDGVNLNGNLTGVGGDGPLTFSVLLTGAPAGFSYVSGGAGVVLVQQGGVTVLTVTVDSATGAYSIVQNAPIDHAAGGDENNVAFTINYNVTDQDGDSAPGTIAINVDDDSPEMNRADVSVPTLNVDETDLGTNASADYSVVFAGAYGADGPGTTSYAVSVVNGTDSGLVDVATGDPIPLFNNAGVVEGRVGGADGPVAFTVSVDGGTGVVTLDQVRALVHPDAANHDDPVSPNATSIQLTASITDADGDSDALTVNIGASIVFEDDGPSISPSATEPNLLVDETVLATDDSADFSGAFTADFGADGESGVNPIGYALGINAGATGLVDTLSGEAVVLSLNGGVVEGRTEIGGDLVFTVTVDADGNVTLDQVRAVVHDDPADHDEATSPAQLSADDLITLTATATDGDGDTDAATVNIGQNLAFEDDGPSVSPTGEDPDLTVDETDLGVGDSADFSDSFSADFGEDGPGAPATSYALGINAGATGLVDTLSGEAVVLSLNGGVVEGRTAGSDELVFTVSVDASGNVTLEQFRAVVHDNPADHDEATSPAQLSADNLITLTATVTDGDGDTDSATINIGQNLNFEDDGPSIVGNQEEPSLTVDETDFGTDDSADFSGSFTADFGEDGPGAPATSYALGINAGATGLVDTLSGEAVVLSLNGGVVEGRTAIGGDLVFTVSVDGSGNVELDQLRAVVHDDSTDHDESTSPAQLSADDLITLTATVTDGDGDTDSATINIGQNLNFEDDGPTAQVDGQATLDTLVLDETTPPGTETDGDSDPVGRVSITANFADNFVTPIDYGADGPGSVSYSFVLMGDDVPSRLYAVDPADTSAGDGDGDGIGRGEQIVLNASGDGLTITGSAGGVDYFTITIDPVSGEVTFTQLDNVWHANTASDDDTSMLMAALGSLLIRQTVVDGDGDSDTADLDVSSGVFQIEDDGPVARNDVDEILAGGDTAEGNVISGVGTNAGALNADDVGADSPGRVSAVSSVNEPLNTDQEADPDVFEIDGEFGTLVLNADGSYTYTRADGAPGNAQDVFTYTLIDADGDTTTATLTINIGDAAPNLPDPDLVQLDDDVVPGADGNVPDGPGDDNPDVVGENSVDGTLAGTGGDGTLTYNFTGVDSLPPAMGFTVNPVDASTLQVLQNGTLVMTIELNNATGEFTVTQNNPIVHPTLNDAAGDDTENNLDFSIGVEVEDADGDVEPAAITINVDDDTPVLTNVQAGSGVDVDETDAVPGGFPISDTSAGAVISATQAFGADGAAAVNSVVYGLAIVGGSPEPSGLATAVGNLPITLVQIDADTIEGQYNGGADVAFTIQMNANGTVTLTQEVPLEHIQDGGPAFHNDTLDLEGLINATITITDSDGDSTDASAPIGDSLVFFDDGPSAAVNGAAQLDTIVLDESPEGTDTAGGGAPTGLASATADFADNFAVVTDFGGDGPAASQAVAYSLFLSAPDINSGLFALDSTDTDAGDGDGYGQGDPITLSIAGGVITGSANGTDYFTISIDAGTGVVTFTQINPIWHPTAPNNFDETATLTTAVASNVQVVQTVTDSDGDTDSVGIDVGAGVFSIQDDGPQAIQPDPASLENEVGASVTEDLDDDGEVITDFGEDGEGLVQFANITNGQDSGLFSDEVAIEYWLSNNGQTLQARTGSTDGTDGELIFTVQINQATGDYTVTMSGTIDNGSGVSFDNLISAKAGNVDVRGVGADDPDTTVDLLLTASVNGVNATINTDSDSLGSGNQSMDQGETVRIDFVTNLEDDPADDLGTFPSGFSYDGHVGTQSLLQTIPQVQGSESETVAFRVYALNTTVTDAQSPDDTPVAGNPAFSDSTTVAITHVTVDGFDVGEGSVTVALGAVGDWTTIDFGVSARLESDGSVTFSGIQQGDQYGIETGTDFNAVAVTSLPAGVGPVGDESSTNSFDLGVFSIGQVDSGDPIDISFDLSITDADGDTVTMPGAIDITFTPATENTLQAPLLNKQAEVDKVAANSNTLTMATAVAAAGMAESVAAAPTHDASVQSTYDAADLNVGIASVRQQSADGAESGGTFASAMPEAAEADPVISSGRGRGQASAQDAELDAGASHQSSDHGPSQQSANDQGPAVAEPQVAVAPTVAMVSAEALQAAGLDGAANQEGSVAEVVAEALGQADAPTVDGLLAHLTGGLGGVQALADVASQDAGSVPGWHMPADGAFGGGFDMLIRGDVAANHHDAIQPAVNG